MNAAVAIIAFLAGWWARGVSVELADILAMNDHRDDL